MEAIIQADGSALPFGDDSVDLVVGSPPYCDARLYLEAGRNRGISRQCQDWVAWMQLVISECVRVSKGLVIINCAGVTRNHVYQPGPEGLLWECWKMGIGCWRPAYWYRVGIPGSGGPEWFRSDIEHLLCFTKCRPSSSPERMVVSVEAYIGKGGREKFRHLLDCGHYCSLRAKQEIVRCPRCVRCLPWSDNTACGHIPKYGSGGAMSHRLSDGARVNQWGRTGSKNGMGARNAAGGYKGSFRPSHRTKNEFGMATDRAVGSRNSGLKSDEEVYRARKITTRPRDGMHDNDQSYRPPVLANPGNLLRIAVGGGLMGSRLAHDNEAPFPEALPEFFIKSFCPPGGKVLDCFSGSGTTADTAKRLGRQGIACDLRMSQCLLTRRRLNEPPKVQKIKSAKRKTKIHEERDLFSKAV